MTKVCMADFYMPDGYCLVAFVMFFSANRPDQSRFWLYHFPDLGANLPCLLLNRPIACFSAGIHL